GRDVAQPVADLRGADTDVERLPRDVDQLHRLLCHAADGHSDAGVRPEAVQHESQVETDDVAVDDPSRAGDAVHDLVVDGYADGLREAVVSEEARPRASPSDELIPDPVQLACGDARHALFLEAVDDAGEQLAGRVHKTQLVFRLE